MCVLQAIVFAIILAKIFKIDFKRAFVLASVNLIITGVATFLLIFRGLPAINYKQFSQTAIAISLIVITGLVTFAVFWILMRYLYKMRINRDQLLDIFFTSLAVTTVFYLLNKATLEGAYTPSWIGTFFK